ncbi:MAG: InlB B-repeat-containing protein [Lachnospiraceae bacterium]
MTSEVFKKYYKKIGRESILKALLCGLTIGFSLMFVCIAASWLAGFKAGIYIGLGLFVAATAIATPLFYTFRFRPTTKKIAQRIDTLGLEERILTMAELENDDSFIAMKQREDALKAMKSVSSEMLKIAVSVPLIAALAISATLGTGMTVAAAVAPDGGKHFVDGLKEKHTYEITYTVEGKGWVIDFTKKENAALIAAMKERTQQREIDKANGKEVTEDETIPDTFRTRLGIVYTAIDETAQATMVLDGANYEDTTYTFEVTEGDEFGVKLMALPQKGYVFVGWSDGVTSPYREDMEATATKTVTATFEKVTDLLNGEKGEGQGQGEEAGDEDSGNSNSSGDGSDGAGMPDTGNSGGEGAKASPANQVINGKTYYGDVFEDAYREMLERMKNNNSLSEAEKKAISDYLDSIRK